MGLQRCALSKNLLNCAQISARGLRLIASKRMGTRRDPRSLDAVDVPNHECRSDYQKQTHSMTVFLPQRLGFESFSAFLWAQAKPGSRQNGLAGSCRPSGQILTSLLRCQCTTHVTCPIHRVLGFQRRHNPVPVRFVSLRESACLKLPKRGYYTAAKDARDAAHVRLHFA
jgi:hypothetical protein